MISLPAVLLSHVTDKEFTAARRRTRNAKSIYLTRKTFSFFKGRMRNRHLICFRYFFVTAAAILNSFHSITPQRVRP